ncbi:hypothetical protein BDN72DRAFT_821040 [Pluteus cervinus]|uniref:Uncharacterized protein n=1 Tax=Pluteus cervinus TaxID=181527 RepID=A0ACD3ASY5_9AGAR|nr:hypothetical protein BDN72DRAFT_821040 [Pluteus cervinus]
MSTVPLVTAPIAINTHTSQNQQDIALVDEKILALQSQIRGLSQRRNELIPVGRLFPEVLVEIFSYLKREWWTGPSCKVPLVLKLTHVSRRWRAVALDCPVLWNEIFFQNETYVAKWLERSQSSNLYISVEATRRHEGTIQKVFE